MNSKDKESAILSQKYLISAESKLYELGYLGCHRL